MKRQQLVWPILLATVCVAVGGCSLYLGDLAELTPSPVGVSVQEAPEILSCQATFIVAGHRDLYERQCGYYWDSRWRVWRWHCWSVWVGADAWGDVVLTLEVRDPSNDLDIDKSPQVHVGVAVPGVDGCGIPIAPTSIPLAPGDVAGSGPTKTVTVRVPSLTVRFTNQCQVLSATFPVSILFRDCSETMSSVNALSVSLRIER